jgi:hypothetical protein
MQADKAGRSAGPVRSNETAGAPETDQARLEADEKSGRRDLIVVNPKQTQRAGKPTRYADALFLAHMFASKFDAPQQREKRRADPADANASYRKGDRQPAKTGRVLSKKI